MWSIFIRLRVVYTIVVDFYTFEGSLIHLRENIHLRVQHDSQCSLLLVLCNFIVLLHGKVIKKIQMHFLWQNNTCKTILLEKNFLQYYGVYTRIFQTKEFWGTVNLFTPSVHTCFMFSIKENWSFRRWPYSSHSIMYQAWQITDTNALRLHNV